MGEAERSDERRFTRAGEAAAHDVDRDALLRLVLDTTQDAFVAMDEEGRIRDWNAAAEVLVGWPREEAVGRLLGESIVPERLREAHAEGLRRFLGGHASGILGQRLELPALRRGGAEFRAELTISPLRVGGGWLFAAFLRDVTERALAVEALERDRGRLAGAQRAGRLGSWEWDVRRDLVTYSGELYASFGFEADQPVPLAQATKIVDPAERERVDELVRAALAGDAPFEFDFESVDADGGRRILHTRANVIFDGDGRPERVIGTDIDVTERADAEAEARRLAAVVAATSDAVITEDVEGRITSWNAGAERLHGMPASEAIGRKTATLVPAERFGEEATLRARVLAGERIEGFETQRLGREGALVDVALTVSPVHAADGGVVEVSTIARDITARKRAERELRRYTEDLDALARQDGLTGLLTQRELHGALDAELARAARTGGRCSPLGLDVGWPGRGQERESVGEGKSGDLGGRRII